MKVLKEANKPKVVRPVENSDFKNSIIAGKMSIVLWTLKCDTVVTLITIFSLLFKILLYQK